MKRKVFIATTLPQEVQEYISGYCDCRTWNSDVAISRQQLLQQVGDVEGLLLAGHRVDRGLLEKAPKLKVVSNIGVGYNNFDLAAMQASRVMGTNTPNVLDETVADLVFGLVLSSARRIPELTSYVKAGNWSKPIDQGLFGQDVHAQTLGIIGMGRIGEAVARRAKHGFNMRVLYHNRRRKPEAEQTLGAEFCPLVYLLQEADFVVLMTPLTPQTVNFMGPKEFDLMKETAFFINASRGETVDEAALLAALEQKKISGAGLDVFVKEPPDPNNLLLQLPNVVALPHIGSATAKTRFAMAMCAAKNLVTALGGAKPANLVDELRGVGK